MRIGFDQKHMGIAGFVAAAALAFSLAGAGGVMASVPAGGTPSVQLPACAAQAPGSVDTSCVPEPATVQVVPQVQAAPEVLSVPGSGCQDSVDAAASGFACPSSGVDVVSPSGPVQRPEELPGGDVPAPDA